MKMTGKIWLITVGAVAGLGLAVWAYFNIDAQEGTEPVYARYGNVEQTYPATNVLERIRSDYEDSSVLYIERAPRLDLRYHSGAPGSEQTFQALIDGAPYLVFSAGKGFTAGPVFLDGEDISRKFLARARAWMAEHHPGAVILGEDDDADHYVSIFYDAGCSVSTRWLTYEAPALREAGVGVRFLPFQATPNAPDQMDGIWCHDDPKVRAAKLEKVIQGEVIEALRCEDVIHDHLALGHDLGARNSPTFVLPNGELYHGYTPAVDLLEEIND